MLFYKDENNKVHSIEDESEYDFLLSKCPLCVAITSQEASLLLSAIESPWLYDCSLYCVKKCNDVNNLKNEKLALNAFEYPAGIFWQTTSDKQQIVTSRALRATSVINGTGGTWDGRFLTYRDKNNVEHDFLTPQEFITFAVAYDDYCTGLAGVCTDHKDALMSIDTDLILTDAEKIAAIAAYDITLNW